ncbi:MAG: DUF1080 domain-containing protein [Planctomycetaceae bacterium]|jgi:hypothetical protein|nr:DUF1080 domain-containing protein [Planctomycetaceae bacterium]MBT6155933.1 DUF1080 domain-containing protein [Planctomycetaceae bacterium]MBT6483152.1 DUF1080 domain-containing protein [Planctomycetaceae bacterium]MBT6497754.1 DUF1080 domain-containing protein [Planctomycetaceae bacterium]
MRGNWTGVLACVLFASAVGCSSEDDNSSPSAGVNSSTADESLTTPQIEWPVEAEDAFIVEPDFTPLTLNDFHTFPEAGATDEPTWIAAGKTLNCSGTPRGYLFSKESYRNFTWRLEYRFLPPTAKPDAESPTKNKTAKSNTAKSNSGFLIYMPTEHKLWPASLEVQGRYDEMGQIKSNSRDIKVTVRDDEQARTASRKPIGEWNAVEIVSRDGALISHINGTKICESDPGELTAGFIGLQAEDFAVQFRHMRIREE